MEPFSNSESAGIALVGMHATRHQMQKVGEKFNNFDIFSREMWKFKGNAMVANATGELGVS